MAKLEEYRRKRDFRRTTEPAGGVPHGQAGESGHLFVVHKHAASHDHFDLRLEQDGVLRSWALPKGPSLEAGEKRLAVEVEDHPLEYADFEGVIPEASYGGGTSMLWDRGRWATTGKPGKDRIDFELVGEKLHGAWTLTRMTGRREKSDRNWLLIKRRDGHGGEKASMTPPSDGDRSVATGRTMREIAEDRDTLWTREGAVSEAPPLPDPSDLPGARRQAMSREASPQLATLVRQAPEGEDWIHEIKFDGYRVLARLEKGEVRLITRNNKDWTHRFPELARVIAQLPVDSALFDGEVVSLGQDGISSFRRLQEALSTGRTAGLVYQAFDLLYLNNHDLREAVLVDRKRLLSQLLASLGLKGHNSVRYADHIESQGTAFFDQACRMGLEGIISKRAESRYQSTRSKDWMKTKCANHEEFVVGGYTDPSGSRSGFGGLLMGAFDDDGRLAYAGRVGTGFNARLLDTLSQRLEAQEAATSPFNGPVPDVRRVHWVRPEMVIEVEFTERTRDGLLRHPAFRGLREDRNPEEIRVSPDKTRSTPPSEDVEPSAPKASPARARGDESRLLGVRLTHPDRILFPEQGLTKRDLAQFYEAIQDWILPRLARRPLSLVRCPQGRTSECFFQKHPRVAIPASVPRIDIAEASGTSEYLYIESASDLVALVQAGALEIHPWGSRIEDVERPDNLVFDLDPAPGVAWQEILRVAGTLRERLASLGLGAFVRTTGGKGLHVVVPIVPSATWDDAKAFTKAVAQQHAQADPRRLTVNMAKSKREGRIFIDYLRNGRGATAVASYSVRAREDAPVCVPVRWDELNAALRSDRYTTENLKRRLAALRGDPWAGYEDAARPLETELLRAVGLVR
ncbi:DNA ligase D [Modicisalibacter xianhensis]|uniref:DNA ligase (ATP) n=1 Tax=Modicisalibacter xianhensis TaxID=442341 RepID=A0A1I3BTV7_9GAMM|nr:DNA ligase D [Halomonas xianhensis]SFH65748.1 bifunctional non-homologous end joining protein LigD [Halomonas xianhensis]